MAYVLLADDDRPFCDIIHRVLVAAGHEVLDAGDGRTCEDMVARREPDLVILDMLMPKKEGIEVIADLRSRHPKLKILAISGGGRASGAEFLTLAKRFGANATLAKPFANSELLSAVQSVLSH
jgi:DNA-binding response OmpR family regulator